MANKTIVQLTSKPTLTTADLIPVGDASTAILYKRTLGDLITGLGLTTGSGTANYLTKWTSANVLGNSVIREVNGNIGIGVAPTSGINIRSYKNITGNIIGYGFINQGEIQSDVTAAAYGVMSNFGTQAASFTLPDLTHFYAIQGAFGAGSVVTRQYGFIAEANLVGATNNYGFYGAIPSGAGRWNLYMNGTANNYLAGNTSIGTTISTYKVNWASGSNFGFLNTDTGGATIGSTGFFAIYTNSTPTEKLRVLANGNVGIGITNPAYRLDVAGDVNINGVFRINGTPINTGGGGAGTITGAGTTDYLPKWTSSSALGDSPISISGTNTNILVGTTGNNAFLTMTSIAPFGFSWSVIRANDGLGGSKTIVYDAADHNWYIAGAGKMYLSGAGDLYINQPTTSGTYKLDVGGAIRSTVDVIITSDKRVKDNIINVTDALSKVDAMQGVYYTRKDIAKSKQYIGFLAQDIEGALPQVVNKDSLGNYGVSYGNITALHNEAIKELNKEIKYLKSIINGSTN